MFKHVLIPSHGKITGGKVEMMFGSVGPEEPITIHLATDENEYTVFFIHLNGRTNILECYI